MAIEGNEYGNNDHVALAADLEILDAEGFAVRPLHELVDSWLANPESLRGCRVAALTCDDGADFDFRDLPHPVAGIQRGFLNILRDYRSTKPHASPGLHMTSFTIVSPEARAILDTQCMIGRKWWNDDWWLEATASGLMGIGNHSWDHNHDCLPGEAFPGVTRGTFRTIDREDLADYQIARASAFLHEHAPGASARLFAYPYGETNDFLVESYLPRKGAQIGVTAAFSDTPEPWMHDANRWCLPRYIFRRDWRSPAALRDILRECH